ncbi:MAG TPA: exonuclease domain-containing protein [Candidatus Saccharimonadia bacterium]|nr:exonuclease domain-containing protein [Candidatus Saccharimonadia bacterium]
MTETIVVIDTETTGLDAAKDAVVELAMVPVTVAELDVSKGNDQAQQWSIGRGHDTYVNPQRPIPPETSAVHHIVDADVAEAPLLGTAIIDCAYVVAQHGATTEARYICAAHNAPFDRAFLSPLKAYKWVCTYRCSLHLWPDAPGFGNQVLRYWLGLKVPHLGDAYYPRSVFPHSALYDAYVTAALLLKQLETHSVSQLLELSETPVILRTCRFGKHAGTPWAQVPKDYLSWASKQTFDGDVKFTIEHYLKAKAP